MTCSVLCFKDALIGKFTLQFAFVSSFYGPIPVFADPWEKGPPAGAAGGADGANEEGRPRGRAHLPPTAHPPADQIVWNARPQDPSPIHRDGPQSPPYKVGLSRSKRASGPQPPYSKDMPLAETHGIHQQLKPLLADGDDMLWRDLAENLG